MVSLASVMASNTRWWMLKPWIQSRTLESPCRRCSRAFASSLHSVPDISSMVPLRVCSSPPVAANTSVHGWRLTSQQGSPASWMLNPYLLPQPSACLASPAHCTSGPECIAVTGQGERFSAAQIPTVALCNPRGAGQGVQDPWWRRESQRTRRAGTCVRLRVRTVWDMRRRSICEGVGPRTAESLNVPICVWKLHVYEKM